MLFPNIIFDVAKGYNQSWLLIEVNDIGDQVASILQYDLEYENILMATMRGREWTDSGNRILWQKNSTWSSHNFGS